MGNREIEVEIINIEGTILDVPSSYYAYLSPSFKMKSGNNEILIQFNNMNTIYEHRNDITKYGYVESDNIMHFSNTDESKDFIKDEYGEIFQNIKGEWKIELFITARFFHIGEFLSNLGTCIEFNGEIEFNVNEEEIQLEITNTTINSLEKVKIIDSNISDSDLSFNTLEKYTIQSSIIMNASRLQNTNVYNSEISKVNITSKKPSTISENSNIENSNITFKTQDTYTIRTSEIDNARKLINTNILNSKISNSNIKSKIVATISNSSSIQNSKIELDTSISPNINKSVINQSDLYVTADELKITNSLLYKNEDINIKGVNNTITFIDSEIGNLENKQYLLGSLYIANSSIKDRVLFFNKSEEWIEIHNSFISQDCIISNNSFIQNSVLTGNTTIFNNSQIIGEGVNINSDENKIGASIDANSGVAIAGYTKVYEKAIVKDKANISGFINIYGESEVSNQPTIYGRVNILDDARVSGKAQLDKEEIINKYDERYE